VQSEHLHGSPELLGDVCPGYNVTLSPDPPLRIYLPQAGKWRLTDVARAGIEIACVISPFIIPDIRFCPSAFTAASGLSSLIAICSLVRSAEKDDEY
jgi:hypothetical protein